MPDVDLLFPKKFLGVNDIPAEGLTVTIDKVDQIEMKGDDGTVEKAVLLLEEVEQGLVLNRTNASKIASIHGRDYGQWCGRKIRLVVDDAVLFKGRLTKGIRVREVV